MEEHNLSAIVRNTRGKGAARQLRRRDSIPAVYYFGREKNLALTLNGTDFRNLMRSKPNLIMLEVEGCAPQECVVRDIQRDPITERIVHVDLMGIKRGQKVKVKVAVHLTGIPVGVKTGGGVLQQNRAELDVECLPKHIERDIDVDVSGLDVSESALIEHLDFPNFKFLHSPKMAVATVMAPTTGRPDRTPAKGGEKKGKEGLTLKDLMAAEKEEEEE